MQTDLPQKRKRVLGTRLTDLTIVVRNSFKISESNSMEMLFIVSIAVGRIARFKFKDTRDIFAKKCYNDKVLVVEELRWTCMRKDSKKCGWD